MTTTIGACLITLDVDTSALIECSSLDEEFSVIKKAFYKFALQHHPDKGGDATAFRRVREAFGWMRQLYQNKAIAVSFVDAAAAGGVLDGTNNDNNGKDDGTVPSWEFYEAAAEEPVPLYKVELAKSGRSRCVQKGKAKKCPEDKEDDKGRSKIDKGTIRIGRFNKDSGTYGYYNHLKCWRVPMKVWLGMKGIHEDSAQVEQALLGMNEVLLCGLAALGPDDRQEFIEHTRNPENWAIAKKKKAKKTKATASTETITSEVIDLSNTDVVSVPTASTAVITAPKASKKQRFDVPRPGVNGALPVDGLAGKRFVLTGLFPEIGGGMALNMGKDKAKALVESFGGKVTASVSGKTDYLLVGQEPGRRKVTMAQDKGVKLLTLKDLKHGLEGMMALEDAQPVLITDYSSGYKGNGLQAVTAHGEETANPAGASLPALGNADAVSPTRKHVLEDTSNVKPSATKKSKKDTM